MKKTRLAFIILAAFVLIFGTFTTQAYAFISNVDVKNPGVLTLPVAADSFTGGQTITVSWGVENLLYYYDGSSWITAAEEGAVSINGIEGQSNPKTGDGGVPWWLIIMLVSGVCIGVGALLKGGSKIKDD